VSYLVRTPSSEARKPLPGDLEDVDHAVEHDCTRHTDLSIMFPPDRCHNDVLRLNLRRTVISVMSAASFMATRRQGVT